jgi:predicted metal-dependent phosphoesterase TrpH
MYGANTRLLAITTSRPDGTFALPAYTEIKTVLFTKLTFLPKKMDFPATVPAGRSWKVTMKQLSTYAGRSQILDGELAEGSVNDITLMNGLVALKLGIKDLETESSHPSGNPIDFSAIGRTDGFDWMHVPILSARKISGLSGFGLSEKLHVDYRSIDVLASTSDSSVVLTKGFCQDLPLEVSNTYAVYPGKPWLNVTSTIRNTSSDTLRFWMGDALDNDEEGQTSLFPKTATSVQLVNSKDLVLQSFKPAQPWMGCFGASDQTFGVFYDERFADDFEVSANTYRIVSQKYLVLPPRSEWTVSRKFCALSVAPGESRVTALSGMYASSFGTNRIESNLTVSKANLVVGEWFSATVSLQNQSKMNAYDQVQVIIKPPLNILASQDTILLNRLLTNQATTVTFNLKALEGSGNAVLGVEVRTKNAFHSTASTRLFVAGKGWYSGDDHTHSTFSDGHSTIEQNVYSAKAKGLTFLNCTDHNTVMQKEAVERCVSPDFLPMVGSEVTTYAGHALALFCDEVIPWDSLKESTLEDAQAIIDNINRAKSGTAVSVIAHPFYPGGSWKWPEVKRMLGYEVFNGFNPYRSRQTLRAFQLWDQKLNEGVRVYGFANSDSHIKEMVGRLRICVQVRELTQASLREAVRAGRFYGSNGPDLRLTIDSVPMGDSLNVPFKKKVHIDMTAYSVDGLDSVRLIKNGSVYKSFKYLDYKRKATIQLVDEVVPGDYFRLEVNDRLDQIAFSNPIFITYGANTTHYVDDPPVVTDTIKPSPHPGTFLYPNPANDFVTLNLDKPTSGELRLFDAQGILRYREALVNKQEVFLHLQNLPKGLYHLQLESVRLKLMVK